MVPLKSLADLPFDILDVIFDFVRQDDIDTRKRTLFAASQVSKEWADMSMRARFHTLSLVVKLEGETSIVNFFLQDFVQEPIFEELKKRQCVKKLTLRWSREGSKSEIDFETILPHHLPLFPGLLSLELRGVLYKRPTARLTQRFNLQSLTIDGHLYHYHSQWYHDQRALCDLLCLFPSLKELKLTDVYSWAHEHHPPAQGPMPAAGNNGDDWPMDGGDHTVVVHLHPGAGGGAGVVMNIQGQHMQHYHHENIPFDLGDDDDDDEWDEENDGDDDGQYDGPGVWGDGAGEEQDPPEGDGGGEPDDSYDVDASALPHIQCVVFDQSTPAPVLMRLFKAAGVKYLDVSGVRFSRHKGEHLLVANACAATLQHLNCELFCVRDTCTYVGSYEAISLTAFRSAVEAQDAPANINLANLPELRRLTLAVEINGVYDMDADDVFHHEPWSTLAATLVTLRKRPEGVPALEYVDLRLEPYRPDQYSNYDEESPMSRARRALTHSKKFSSCVDAELDSLVDAGLVEAVRVSFGGGARKPGGLWALRPHSCLHDLLVAAFPTMHAKGRLHLGNEVCEC